MNKCELSHNSAVYDKTYSVKDADNKGKAQYQMSITRLTDADIEGGLKCMHEAIRIFREINQFYRDRYENEDSKLFFELMSANQHTSKNDHAIALLRRCISLLDYSKECLPFVVDVLNGHDIFPNLDSEMSQGNWSEKRAECRFSKCIDRLERSHLEEGLILMQEVIQYFQEAIVQYNNTIEPWFADFFASSKEKHIKTIERCFSLLKESDQHLPLVINVFKGKESL